MKSVVRELRTAARSVAVYLPALSLVTACSMDEGEPIVVTSDDTKADVTIQQPFELGPGQKTPAAVLSLDAGDSLRIEVNQDTNLQLELEVFIAGATTKVSGQDPKHVVVVGSGGGDGDVVVRNLSSSQTAKGRIVFVPGGEDDSDMGEIRINETGILQFFHNDQWRGVCDDGFGSAAAVVACRQLGGTLKSFTTGQTGPTSTFWIDDLECSGDESRIDECSHAPLGVENCGANESVKLECDLGSGADRYSAVCHVDDDPEFTEGQFIVGELTGKTLQAIGGECAEIAAAMFPGGSSSGLRGIKILGQPTSSDKFTAVCHVDDDPEFTEGQFIIATNLFGPTVQGIVSECATIATMMFPSASSSGLRNIQILGQPTTNDKVIATCHVDDDPEFTEGQFIVGDIFGPAISNVEQDCKDFGNAMFPGVSSTALRNIRFCNNGVCP